MAVYVIVIGAAILLLAVCYRSLGGGQSRQPDAAALLGSASRILTSNLALLDQHLVRSDGVLTGEGEVGGQGRRGAAAIQHSIDLLSSEHKLDEGQASARDLLAAAAEDLNWAWRIAATPNWTDHDGLRVAVTSLRDHAVRCAERASPLLAGDPSREPVESA